MSGAEKSQPWEMTTRALRAILRRVEALETSIAGRTEREIAGHRVNAAGQFVIELADGREEVAGIVREGD